MAQFSATTMSSISSGIVQMMLTGKLNVASFTQAILADLMKIIVEKEIAGIVGGLMGGMGGASTGVTYDTSSQMDSMASSIPTGFAGGGTVQAGVPIPVGERGPEMFVPNVGGNIVSNSALGASSGGTGNVQVSITNNGTAQTVKSATPSMSGKDIVVQIVLDDFRTGGKISSGMQTRFGLTTKAYQ
jgi:lambda family phage tail tape measure protein